VTTAKVLIVQDVDNVALDLRARLTGMGFQVTGIAAGVEQALSQITASRPDVVLVDTALPGVAGEELRDRLGIPVIYLAGGSNDDWLNQAHLVQGLDYVSQPFPDRDLYAAIRFAQYRQDVEEKARARCQSLFDHVPLGLYRSSPDGCLLDANPALVEMLGYGDRESLLAVNLFEQCADPEDRRRCQALVECQHQVQDLETRFRKGDGTLIWVRMRARPVCDGRGRLLYYEGSIEEITERRRFQDALRRQADLSLLTLFANYAAIAVENARLHEQAQQEIAERKRLEQKIEERRVYLESVLNCAPDAIVTTDAQHIVQEWNPGAEKLYGYCADEARGQNLDDLIAFPDARMFKEATGFTAQVLEGKPLPLTETVRYRKDGTPVDVTVAGAPILVEGELSGVVAVYTDITEDKQIEEALRESEELYRTLIRTSPDAVTMCDLDGKVTFASPQTLTLHGFVQEKEIIGRNVLELIAPQDHERALVNVRQTLEKGLLRNVDYMLQRQDGTCFFGELNSALIAGADGKPKAFIACTRDITERKQAEEELKGLKNFNESIVQNMAEGIVVQDKDGRLTFLNPAAAHLLGYEVEELLEEDWTLLVPRDQWPIVEAADRQRRKGEASRYDVELVRRDGSRIPVLVSGIPRFGDGEFEGTLAVFTDISERVHAEQVLARRAQEMAALYETALEINTQPDIPTLLKAIVQRAAELMGAPMGSLYLLRQESRELELVVGYNLPKEYAGTTLHLGEGLSGRVAQTGHPLVVADYRAWEGRASVHNGQPFRRVLGVPLKLKGNVIGVINITDVEQAGSYTQEEIRLVSLFADQAAIAIENARLLEAEARRRREAETLQAATRALTATLNLQQVFESILRELRQVVPYDSASVQQLGESRLEIIGGHGFPNLDELLGVGFDLTASDNPNRIVVQSQEPLILEDAPVLYREFRREPHAPAGIRSWMGVPLLFGERLIGMIALDKKEPGFYTEEHAQLAQAFAAQAAIAIENARLFSETEQRLYELRLLFNASTALSTSLDPDAVMRAVIECTISALNAQGCTISRWDQEQDILVTLLDYSPRSDGWKPEAPGTVYHLADFPATRQVLLERKPVAFRLSDPHTDPHERAWMESEGLLVLLMVPMIVRDKVIGLLEVMEDQRDRQFTSTEIALCQTLASQSAAALENARLFQAERKQRQLAEALRQATVAISSTLDIEQVLDQILEQVNRVMPSDAANVMLIEGDEVRIVRSRGYDRFDSQNYVESVVLHVEEVPCLRHMFDTRQALVVADTTADAAWTYLPEESWLRSLAAAPICARDRVIGFLNLDSATVNFFSQGHADRLRIFADQASLALEHARLYKIEQRRAREAASLSAVAQALNATTDLNSVLHVVARELPHMVSYDRLSLALLTEDEDHFVTFSFSGEADGPSPSGTTLPLEATAAAADVQRGRPHIAPDLASEIDFPAERALYDAGWRSQISIPLILSQSVIGSLTLASRKIEGFSPDQVPILTQVADAVAATVQTVRLYEEIVRRNRELTLLNRIIAASAASQEISSILETVCRELALAFDVPQSAAVLFDREKTQAVVVAEYLAEGRPSSLGKIIPAVDNSSSQYLLQHRKPLVIDNAQTDPAMEPVRALMRQRGTVSLLVVPLIIGEEVVGTLGLDAIEYRPFSEEEVDLARRVAEQVSSSLARARLVEDQKRLSTAVEQAADAVVIADSEGKILFVNPAFERITGLKARDIIGSGPEGWKDQNAATTFYQEFWSVVRTGQPQQGPLASRRPDGTSYRVDLLLTPVRNEAGNVVNCVGTLRDVTREVQLEEQFYQAQKMEALGQLAGGIAHDFNNLLTVINLSTQLLRRRLHPEDPLWEHVVRISEAGERAAKLTRQLLSFSRREIAEPTVVALNRVVDDLGSMLQRVIGENIVLNTNLTPGLWPIKVDPSQLDQVILNLVVNARDAMPQGGMLSIETANVILDRARAAAHLDAKPGEYVQLTIRDTGVGMDETVKSHLFEPFFTTKEPGQGTGLGLATVFGIVKQSGGHIHVESESGLGTTFEIYLPRSKEGPNPNSVAPHPQAAHADKLARGAETVLVVEDKSDVRKLATEVLKSCGYQVLAAGHGLEALQISELYHEPIDLLITDIVMPKMNGRELAEKLRSRYPRMRVLYMSGYADGVAPESDDLELEAQFLPKPFTVEALVHKVRSTLDDRA
jgi:two-component system cell cycle sensor histidine kinase/response regulator CckA